MLNTRRQLSWVSNNGRPGRFDKNLHESLQYRSTNVTPSLFLNGVFATSVGKEVTFVKKLLRNSITAEGDVR